MALSEASEEAAQTGDPVVVDEYTTETTQVEARPEGGFKLTSHRSPVRVQTDDGWAPVDDTLAPNGDGTFSPVASPADVRFSGGGTGPLVTFTTDDGDVSLTWPTALPTPAVEGDTATYANVLPGVDLNLVASPEGYKQIITVKTREAAANPDVRALTMTAHADGLELSADAHGALTATNASGDVVLAGPRPYQWDSSVGTTGETPTDEATGPAQVDLVDVTLPAADGTEAPASAELELTPDVEALSDPDTVFPVRIDPSMSKNRQNYLTVQSGGWNYFNDTGEPMRVGKCYGSACDPINGTARSYFQFNTDAISDQPVTATIFDAKVIVTQIHNASCSATPVTLYSAGSFTSSTTWNGPEWDPLQTISSKAGNSACGNADADLAFNNDAVDAHVQYIANNDYNSAYFGLISSDESTSINWKKFSINPELVVIYDFGTDPPTGLGVVGSIACPGKPVYANATTTTPGPPGNPPVTTPAPEAYTAQADNNNPTYTGVDLLYYVRAQANQSAALQASGQIYGAENQLRTWNSAAQYPTPLAEGNYFLQVQSQSASPDNLDLGAWSGYYAFTIDRTGPAVTPSITSHDYPADSWGAPSNYTNGAFTITGSSDAAFYSYAIDGASPPAVQDTDCSYTARTSDKKAGFVPADSTGRATLIPGATLTPGYHSMVVRAHDAAHNAGTITSAYVFYVAPVSGSSSATVNSHRVEAESLAISQPSAQMAATMTGYAGPGYPTYVEPSNSPWWSGGVQSHVLAPSATVPSATAPEFTYTLPSVAEGTYSLGVRVTSIWHYAKVEFLVDGQLVRPAPSDPALRIDTYSAAVGFTYVNLGEKKLTQGTHTISVRLVDKNASATAQTYNGTYGTAQGSVTLNGAVGYSLGIDYFTVAQISGSAFPTLASAFNNNGITTDTDTSATAGNLTNVIGTPLSLSEAALSAAGLGTGQNKVMAIPGYGNVTFNRPAPVGGKDNLISLGQTITIPSQIVSSTTAVHFLVASSCGPLPSTTLNSNQLQFVIDGGETVTIGHTFGSVPDWLTPTTTSMPTVTLASHKAGTATRNDPNWIYVISAKPSPDYVNSSLVGVTLPAIASSTLPSATCGSAKLHVLAMTVQP